MTLNAQNHPICNILSVYFTIDEGFIQLYDSAHFFNQMLPLCLRSKKYFLKHFCCISGRFVKYFYIFYPDAKNNDLIMI